MRDLAQAIFSKLLYDDVRFVVIGALAATMHGSHLRTGDIDLCPDGSPENLDRLARALNDLEANEWDPRKGEEVQRSFDAELLASDRVWMLVIGGYQVDLIFEPAGTGGYEDLAARAIGFDVEGRTLLVASLEDLIASKEALDRPKDQDQMMVLRRLLNEQPES